MMNIFEMCKSFGLGDKQIIPYGYDKAKIDIPICDNQSKLVLVTAMSPTKYGEGKTTVSIGLADALSAVGAKACLALREPSLGPVFGIKGGATGGGLSQVVPNIDINLHFTGDFHAITSANNLLSSIIDNHIYWGNELNIVDVVFNRCIDINDRALRAVDIGRPERLDITSASEIMSIVCLARDFADLRKRIGNITVGYDGDGAPVYARQLSAVDAMCILLKDAMLPNMVQTLYGTPAIIHGGPFANIAHGCNSVIGTRTAMSLADIVVTEAGFGADLGAEKFFDVKCRVSGIRPDCVVMVATLRAIRHHGGLDNLIQHIDNMVCVYNMPVVVAMNRFADDDESELQSVMNDIRAKGIKVQLSEGFSKGATGCVSLAEEVLDVLHGEKPELHFAYDDDDSIKQKLHKIATKIYHAKDVIYTDNAMQKLEKISSLGADKYPIIVAKTQYSFTDDAKILSAPIGHSITVKDVKIRTGAECVIIYTQNILLMPALSRHPASENMKIDNEKNITGLK